MAVGPLGGVDDERGGVAVEPDDLPEVEKDVEVALGVDDVAQDGVDPLPVLEPGDTVDGDDDRAAGAADADAETGCAVRDGFGVLAAWCRDVPFLCVPDPCGAPLYRRARPRT